ncbi:HK97 family phage prohead protease [Burkholderia ubonensis]|uniref:HK97 family phage prohead protease n=1 Tax=Burkholderia ubonensis TaxID=101571 RepID=UPI000752F91B|nr:HK97 family phage prohead protease [Burkholderia ubonensis]KVU27554.1 primosome assembly protein PriA [Burkholderia ubonensis]
MLVKRMDCGFEIKAVKDTGEFEGYGSVFNVIDSYGDIVQPGAFTKSLSAWAAKGRLPAMLWQHQASEPIGVYTAMHEDQYGLFVAGRLLVDDDPLAKRAHAHMKAGSISGLSIGYSLAEGGYTYDSGKGAFLLSEINLWEVSPVTFPANEDARVQTVKSALAAGTLPDARTFESMLRDMGFSEKQAGILISKGYWALDGRGDVDPVGLADLKSAILARGTALV